MGIYLRLQSFILRTFQFPSHLIIFPEEGVDSGNHKVIILIKRTNFVPVYNIRGFLQYPVFGPLHITAEQINTSGDGMGNRFGEKPGQKQDQKGNTDNNLDEWGKRQGKGGIGYQRNHIPFGSGNESLHGHIALAGQLYFNRRICSKGGECQIIRILFGKRNGIGGIWTCNYFSSGIQQQGAAVVGIISRI